MLFKITEAARAAFQETLQSPDFPEGYFIRLGRKGTACAGSYLIGLDRPTPADELHVVEGLTFIVDPMHILYLANCEVDYGYTNEGLGFSISTP